MSDFEQLTNGIKRLAATPEAEGGQVLNENFTLIDNLVAALNSNVADLQAAIGSLAIPDVADLQPALDSLNASISALQAASVAVSDIHGLQAALDAIAVHKSTLGPTADDDGNGTAGNGTFAEGDRWYSASTNELYICVDATPSAADWRLIPVTNSSGEIEGPIIARESTGNDIPIESELVVFNNELRLGDNLTQNGLKIGHPQNSDTGTTSASFQVNSANQTSGPGNGSFQAGDLNNQTGSYSIQSGSSSDQSGDNSVQVTNNGSQSSIWSLQVGGYVTQTGGSGSLQAGGGSTQNLATGCIQAGGYHTQSGYCNAQFCGDWNLAYGHTQSGNYGFQAGRYGLNDGGNDSTIMYGQSKTASIGSAAYFWLDNGIRIKPVSTPPASPEKGTIYFSSVDNKLKIHNGTSWRTVTTT